MVRGFVLASECDPQRRVPGGHGRRLPVPLPVPLAGRPHGKSNHADSSTEVFWSVSLLACAGISACLLFRLFQKRTKQQETYIMKLEIYQNNDTRYTYKRN